MATDNLIVSDLAENLIGSEIIRLAGEIKKKMETEKIYNFTIGDFNPDIFPIPEELNQEIVKAYQNNITNYPPANGIAELRMAISNYLNKYGKLDYDANQILVAGGARPLIYAAYMALVDPEDGVLFPVPSWNNNHYTYLARGKQILIETKPENNFMPTADDLKDHIKDANLVALCSPLNPTGTVFSEAQLRSICELVIEENRSRKANEKPVYILYDQIYWQLTYGDTKHFDPVSLYPELKEYTLYIDGISKSFAATGVRVGWAFGPQKIIDKMKSILGHIGAWSPKAEQHATAIFLENDGASKSYMTWIKEQALSRLEGFYKGIQSLKAEGFQVDAIQPQAAIYLTVKFDLKGKTTADGKVLKNTEDVNAYLLNEAKLAIVPFYAFGASKDSSWFRLSIGTASEQDVIDSLASIKAALQKLN